MVTIIHKTSIEGFEIILTEIPVEKTWMGAKVRTQIFHLRAERQIESVDFTDNQLSIKTYPPNRIVFDVGDGQKISAKHFYWMKPYLQFNRLIIEASSPAVFNVFKAQESE